MSFKLLPKKPTLEDLTNKNVQIEFSEGPRKGIIQETKDPSYPYSFNFEKMGIQKELFLKPKDLHISKNKIQYTENFYALENHF